MTNIFHIAERSLFAYFDNDIMPGKIGPKFVFSMILALFEEKDRVTKADIVKRSKALEMTTYKQLRLLEEMGLIRSWKESQQFYSPMFIELTDKGKLTASRLRRAIVG